MNNLQGYLTSLKQMFQVCWNIWYLNLPKSDKHLSKWAGQMKSAEYVIFDFLHLDFFLTAFYQGESTAPEELRH